MAALGLEGRRRGAGGGGHGKSEEEEKDGRKERGVKSEEGRGGERPAVRVDSKREER